MSGGDARHSDAQALAAWRDNAAPWTHAVRAQAIESRRLVSDRAVLEAAASLRPRDALGLSLRGLGQPVHPQTQPPVSLVLLASADRSGATGEFIASGRSTAHRHSGERRNPF